MTCTTGCAMDSHQHAGHADDGYSGRGGRHQAEPAHAYREEGRRRLLIALALIVSYMVVEVVVGMLSSSLALLADAAHMLTRRRRDRIGAVAIWISNRPASIQRTFGYYRTEVLAALFNAVNLGYWQRGFSTKRTTGSAKCRRLPAAWC